MNGRQSDSFCEDKKKELIMKRRELEKNKKRIIDINLLIQSIYEDNESGKLPDKRYAAMAYEEGQRQPKEAVRYSEVYPERETEKNGSKDFY